VDQPTDVYPPAPTAAVELTGLELEIGTLQHPGSGATIRVLKLSIAIDLSIPFTQEAAQDFAQNMSGGIVISKEMPNGG
jgi:hypothetical protein